MAAALKGSMTCDFTHVRNFFLLHLLLGWNLCRETGILSSGLDLGHEAKIWVSRLEFRTQGWNLGLEDGI